jgi:biopolymer transport protein ExbD
MEPLNKSERNRGMIRFLIVFVAGILIVLIPFYFLVRLPEKEQQVNSEQLNSLQGQLDFQKSFTAKMDSVMKMMERYDLADVDMDKLNADIGLVLSEMGNSIKTGADDSGHYQKVVNVLVELKKAKSGSLKSSADLDKARKDLEECQKEMAKMKEKPSDSLEH